MKTRRGNLSLYLSDQGIEGSAPGVFQVVIVSRTSQIYRRKGLRISRSSPTFIAGEHKKGNMSFHHYLNLSLVTRFLVVFLCRCFIPIKMFVYCFMSRITFTSKEGDKKLLSNELNEYNFSRNVHHWSFKCYFS